MISVKFININDLLADASSTLASSSVVADHAIRIGAVD